MNQKRVLQCNVDECDFGGVFALVAGICEELYKSSDIRFDFCATEKFKDERSIKRIENLDGRVFYLGYSGNKILKQFVQFKRYYNFLRDNPYDVVHVHADLSFKLFIPALAAKLCKVKKIIVHSHSSGVDGTNRKIKFLAHKMFKVFLPLLADVFMSCSDKAAKWMFPKRIKDVLFIRNGIDVEKFRFNPEVRMEYRKKYNFENNFVIGHVGGFKYVKNHDFLIDIFEQVFKKDNTARLILIGEGELKEKIQQKVEKLNLTEGVIFWGGSYEVFNLYQMMDLFVFPSRFEGFGVVIIEAQAAGLKLICSDDIPIETAITENIKYLSFEQPAKVWADKIIDIKNIGYIRKDTKKEIENAMFDRKYSAQMLSRIYEEI